MLSHIIEGESLKIGIKAIVHFVKLKETARSYTK